MHGDQKVISFIIYIYVIILYIYITICICIYRKNASTNRALLGYLAQGNTRMLGVREEGRANGRFLSRAIARLLVCKKTGETVLFLDKPYDDAGGSPSTEAEVSIYEQALALSAHLSVGLYTYRDVISPSAEDALQLIEVDGAAEYVWREGEEGYGVQERGVSREVTLAFVAPR